MKILFLINSLKNKSGSERVAIELANRMTLIDSHEVVIVNRDSNIKNCAYPVSRDIKVIALGGGLLSFFNKLKNHISINCYDKIIIHNMGKLILLCTLLPFEFRERIVSLEHVSFISRPQAIQILSKYLYKKVGQIVTLTSNDKQNFEKFHNNVIVIPNFSPFEINITNNLISKNILSIGRLTDQKNYIHLLKAWSLIGNKILDWNLVIYGDGEHKDLLLKYIEEHKLENVFLKGVTSDVVSVYKESDFFVMSSKYEGLPMVLIEAQTFGLPIVSYNCPYGPADVVTDDYNGFLVENQDIQMLADKILNLATSPILLSEFSKNSFENAKKYQAEQILNIWTEKVLKG